MVTVHEVLTLKSFNAFRLVAGVNGLDRVVSKGGFIDHETSEDVRYSEFKNELVFSSLPMIKDQPEKIVDFVQALIESKTAAFAIKSIFFESIPEDAIQLANENNYPLFSFDDTYIEELILDIDEIVNDQKYIHKKIELINDIESGQLPPYKIKNYAYELNQHFQDYTIGCMIKPKSIGQIKPDLKSFKKLLGKSAAVLPIENNILILNSKKDKELKASQILQLLGVDQSFYVGISDVIHDLSNLDQVIIQCKSALKYACLKDQNQVNFSEIGIYQVLLSLLDNQEMSYYYNRIINILISYDQTHQSELLTTARAYIEADGDIKLASEKLFQHQNTIRYRIRKIKSLLLFDELEGMKYETLALAVHLYELNINRDKLNLL